MAVSEGPVRPHHAPTTLTDWAIEEVRARIVLSEFAPGERLPIDELATELGISRVPLREAIRRLEAEGMVVTTPHRGAVTTALTAQDADDAYHLLNSAEQRVVERAAKVDDPASTELMERCLATMQEHLGEQPLSREALEAHRRFHFAFFDRAGEGVLLRQLRILWYTCERYVVASIPDRRRAKESYDEHRELLRLLVQGEAQAAAEHLEHHLLRSLNAVKERLQRHEL